ncbi:hypothetical protein AGMMS50239_14420 [Bacteroidia bacterium]|nr:hypothetical protein AGMMS50239_14420 [Bacteroidia bacterium]
MKKLIFTLAVLVWVFSVKAQDNELSFSVGGDLVSSYVWRGALAASASIQPAAGLSIAGFSLSAWGSTDITSGDYKEVDFTAGYSIAGLSLAVTDYWWMGERNYKYFNHDSESTDHLFEFTVGYTLPVEKFPLSLTWNTMFAGADVKKGADDKRAYSTYIEAKYPFAIKDIALEASLGLTPGKSLYAEKASVASIGLKAIKNIKISDGFSLPVYGQILTNPRSEDIFFVFGITL